MVFILGSRCQQLPSPVVASACAVSDVLPHCTDGRCCLSQCMISPDFSFYKKKKKDTTTQPCICSLVALGTESHLSLSRMG